MGKIMGTVYIYIYIYIILYMCVCACVSKKNLHVQNDYGKLCENQMIVTGCCSSENHRTIAGECFQQAVELMTLEFMCSWTKINNDLEVLPDTRPLTANHPNLHKSSKLGPGLHDNSWPVGIESQNHLTRENFVLNLDGLEPITSTFYRAAGGCWRGAPALLPTHHLSHPRIIAGAATQIVD